MNWCRFGTSRLTAAMPAPFSHLLPEMKRAPPEKVLTVNRQRLVQPWQVAVFEVWVKEARAASEMRLDGAPDFSARFFA